MKLAASLFLASILVLLTPTLSSSEQVKPRTKIVNYERTAIRIAEAVLADAYGEEQLKLDLPLKATLEKGVWIVKGSFPQEDFHRGGIAAVSITEEGCVVSVTHGK